jgi:hypothetical protein
VRAAIRAAAVFAVGCAFALALTGCSSAPKKPGTGFRTLEATVVSRDYEAPASARSNGVYYLVFEARDGDATATYKFEVNKMQYTRYTEGSHVQIVLADNELRDIKPLQ